LVQDFSMDLLTELQGLLFEFKQRKIQILNEAMHLPPVSETHLLSEQSSEQMQEDSVIQFDGGYLELCPRAQVC
jgi:hypothetical protein